jgi:hypothetical protein
MESGYYRNFFHINNLIWIEFNSRCLQRKPNLSLLQSSFLENKGRNIYDYDKDGGSLASDSNEGFKSHRPCPNGISGKSVGSISFDIL